MSDQDPGEETEQARTYTYVPLPDEQSIRMLTLHPGKPDDPLKGELDFVNIESAEVYEALSYVWGDSTPIYSITCNTAELGITTSVYYALKRLRLPHKSRRLWTDQICIDQQNLDERSQQVQFMNRIYWNASHVLVWLGLDNQKVAEAAFKLVQDLAEKFDDENKHSQFRADHTHRLAERSKDYWIPLTYVTGLPWFTRAWIVQEIGTGAPATLFWGEAEIEWQIMHSVCEQLTEYHRLRKKFDIQTAEIKYIFQRFIEPERTNRHANRFSFIYELHRARHLKVTDARDRVFAMIGHYSIRDGPNQKLTALKADYKKSVEQVYTEVAVRALTGDKESLITLAAIQHMDLPSHKNSFSHASGKALVSNEHTLPSWVPDWRTYQSHILSEPTSPHFAGGKTSPTLEVDASLRRLKICGVKIDTIQASSEKLKPKEFHVDKSGREFAIERLWHDICGMGAFDLSERYRNKKDSALFAYCQTLSNGCVAISWQEKRPYNEAPEQDWRAHGMAYLTKVLGTDLKVSQELRDMARKADPDKWSRAANGASSNRTFARTTGGYYVLGPAVMEAGDIICVLFGGKMPFCLRPWGLQYLLVGECYVHGLMKGEAIEMLERKEVEEMVFKII